MMTKPTRIFIVRHGQSIFNEQNLISGHVDPPLSDKGRKQVEDAREELGHIKFDIAYSSDLQRAAHTAEIIFGAPITPKNQITELRERNYGSLEGQPGEQLDSQNKIKMTLPMNEVWHHRHVPDMESDYELATRFTAAVEEIAKKNPGKTILIGAHGTAIRVMLIMLQNLTHKDLPNGAIRNAGYVELSYSDKGLEVIDVNAVTK